MVNAERIRRVAKRIQNNLKKWDQSTWGGVVAEDPDAFEAARAKMLEIPRGQDGYGEAVLLFSDGLVPEGICGTGFCFAGHTVLDAGDAILIDPDDVTYSNDVLTAEGDYLALEHRAQMLLGLDMRQASRLFDGEAGHGNWEAYKRLVTEVTGVDLSDL
jgi:hypothetical protein